ncbi:dihydrofolate reductase [Paenibacillus sp. 1011MAR3C5]|uniref:dihydrofolate reductase n=1 Tax=Paenibacillus sp. 1011MAR3C5 TaxID=1675787 RepID=UPI000E6D48BB|nr:dihydrofolate reductase [Paenibacillus sp. 1011MAR3C5]RJE90198.1 dihydrofolate reductase [Paenibacillus sp. 1011MAR3C5]
MTITLIAAMDRNRAIGVRNELPWRLPEDMAYFRRMTTGKTVLMGRKTFESLGRPLPNRRNVVLTRQTDLHLDGCEVIHRLEDAIRTFGEEELMIIGGAEIYALALPHADRILLTEVEMEVDDADAYFPAFDERSWRLASSEFKGQDERNPYDFTFQTYERADR